MKITISNEIRIDGAPQELVKRIKKQLTMDNPEYSKKKRMGFWVGNTPKVLSLYWEDAGSIYIPCGAGTIVQPFITPQTQIIEDLAGRSDLVYEGQVELYDYQEAAVTACVRAGRGILQSPCGSGKTQMGIGLAAALRGRTLWVTHTNDLLEQSYERAVKYFPASCMGKIAAGKVSIGSHFTFATVQTLSRLDLTQYKYLWDTVIVDECHRVAGSPAACTMFYRVMSALAARYKYGLTATAHRSDGLIKTTYAVIGPVIYQVPDSAVKEKTMQVAVQRIDTHVETSEQILDTDGTISYGKLIPYLAGNMQRNDLIGKMLRENKGHSCLVLSDRLEHLQTLLRYVDPEDAALIDGKMQSKRAKAQRLKAIEDMRSGKKHYLFASYGLAKEGLDIPRLDRLFLTLPRRDYSVVTQSVGRIARAFEGKEQPVCYDFVDQIGFCERSYKKRKTSYRKAGCLIWEQ